MPDLLRMPGGRTWMFYHAYDTSAPDIGRQGMLDEVRWDKDGWPYIATGTPSPIAKAPVID